MCVKHAYVGYTSYYMCETCITGVGIACVIQLKHHTCITYVLQCKTYEHTNWDMRRMC